jgi:hypothetical protein
MARQQASEYVAIGFSQTVLLYCPAFDLTELTTGADYIHSAELVNMRYPRQTLPDRIFAGSPADAGTYANLRHDNPA